MATTPTVRDVMTSSVSTLTPEQTVEEAADLLAARGIGAAPVVEDGRLVGLLRDDDLIVSEARLHAPTVVPFLGAELVLPGSMHRFEQELRRVAASTVREVMSTQFPTVSPDDSLEALATIMHEQGVTHVPVVEGGELVGIVTRGDLVRHLAATT